MGLDRAPIEFQTFYFFHVWLVPPNVYQNILEKVEIWTSVSVRLSPILKRLTHRQTLKDRATQLLRSISGALIKQCIIRYNRICKIVPNNPFFNKMSLRPTKNIFPISQPGKTKSVSYMLRWDELGIFGKYSEKTKPCNFQSVQSSYM